MKQGLQGWHGLLAVLAFTSGAACADPQEGFGLAIGPVFHHAHEVIKSGASDTTYNFNSSGVGLTGDAQFVLDSTWTANPFLQTSFERSSGDIKSNLDNSQAGLGLRYWSGDAYIGPILEISDEQFLQHGTISRSLFGPGLGIGTGWESPSGLTLALQLDAPQSLNFNAGDLHAGAWLSIGYRWH